MTMVNFSLHSICMQIKSLLQKQLTVNKQNYYSCNTAFTFSLKQLQLKPLISSASSEHRDRFLSAFLQTCSENWTETCLIAITDEKTLNFTLVIAANAKSNASHCSCRVTASDRMLWCDVIKQRQARGNPAAVQQFCG